MSESLSAREVRRAILSAPLESTNAGDTPANGTLYVPIAHLKALRLDSSIVIGARGVGKSFWTSALQSPDLRSFVGTAVPEIDGVDVHVGFGTRSDIHSYPSPDVFARFLDGRGDPFDLWRAVVLRWVARQTEEEIPTASWADSVSWIKANPEQVSRIMESRRTRPGLIVFDALDRTSTNWNDMDSIVRGLLRAVLWTKTFPKLHAKVFLREDQAEREVFNFPDASKLRALQAELTWARHDLHGLLWQRLVNAPGEHGKNLRALCETRERNGVWAPADEMKRDSDAQRAAFRKLAGPWMGRDRRRGVPYTWAVGHLADGRGRTTPRSFLSAIRQGAEDSEERYPDHDVALHYESIKRGIQKASENRVFELAEEYPWVVNLLTALEGMNVPSPWDDIVDRWRRTFPEGPDQISPEALPAQHADRGWDGVRSDLERLGLIETRRDGRIDMPDLYRVGFRLGRKGGVKPKS